MKPPAQLVLGARSSTASGLFCLLAAIAIAIAIALAQDSQAQDEKGGESGRFYEVQEAVGDGTFQTTTLWEPIEELDEAPDAPVTSGTEGAASTPIPSGDVANVGGFLIAAEEVSSSTYQSSLTLLDEITVYTAGPVDGSEVRNAGDGVDPLEPGGIELGAPEVDLSAPEVSPLDFRDPDPGGVTGGSSLDFSASTIPEPSRLLLTLLGLGALLVRRRRGVGDGEKNRSR